MARSSLVNLALATALTAIISTPALACESKEMAVNDSGFILKVVAGSDKIIAYESPATDKEFYTLDLLQPFFVICEEGDFFRITDVQANTVDEAMAGKTGYVRRDQVFVWPTREALNFNALIFESKRPEIRAWEDEKILNDFMRTGDLKRFPPAFEEDLDSTLKRPRDTRPYPVLGSDMRMLRETVDKRVFKALIPAALPPTAGVVLKEKGGEAADPKKIEKVLSSVTFLVIFDATGSMEKVARQAAKDLITAFNSIDEQVRAASQVGFIFYRDSVDREKIVISKLLPIEDGANLLLEAANRMEGGGNAEEPILDATYIGANYYFPVQQGIGRQVLIGVLNGDAYPTTTGGIDDRVPDGLGAAEIGKVLLEKGMTMITMQASNEEGPNLRPVLQTLAESSGGQFIEWKNDEGKAITGALAAVMKETVIRESMEGGKIAQSIFDYKGYPAIPLKVLDGERMERLRRAGIDFNIEDGEGGVLVREGFIIENPDLLEPRVQMEKETLTKLVNLFNVLGTIGVDTESTTRSMGEAIAAIAGEAYDPNELVSDLVKRRLGIQFRTGLLAFEPQYLAGLTQKERLTLAKRIQDAGNTLGEYMQGNLAQLDSEPFVWMPMSVLP